MSTETVRLQPAILSVIGYHANESPNDIVLRKAEDIKRVGFSLWVYQSWKARVGVVQEFATKHVTPAVYFLKGNAVATSASEEALQMSIDQKSWALLPKDLGKVTGKLKGGCALVLGELQSASGQEIDLWNYAEYPNQDPIKFQLGASTTCAIPSVAGGNGMRNHIRDVVVLGKLVPPYAVFVR